VYKNKPNQFFAISQSIDYRLGDTLSFVWANYSAFRNMWCQVRGLKVETPENYLNEAHDLYYSDFDSPGGVDFKKMCIDTEWQKHEQEYAKWLVLEACTLYEGWIEEICGLVLPNGCNPRDYIKTLQFPNSNHNGQLRGHQVMIKKVNDTASSILKSQFLPKLKTSKLNKWDDIDSYLLVYRYFKECRNGFIHSGGLITSNIKSLYHGVMNIQSPNSSFDGRFNLIAAVEGEPIVLNLRSCIHFVSLVRNLIATFDAALCVSKKAEDEIFNKVRRVLEQSGKWNLPIDPIKRANKVNRILVAARIPDPIDIDVIDNWLKNECVLT